jgi:hypothetical protein
MWKSTHRRPGIPGVAAAAAVFCLGTVLGLAARTASAGSAAGQPDPQSTAAAVWTPKEVNFVYMGFTTYYSCDGLRDAIQDMLLRLGARKDDLKVTELPCSGDPTRPNPFPGVRIKMSVLTPAPSAPSSGTETVQAQWKTVKLPYRETLLNAAGQCELLEQFKQKILPAFTTRNVDLQATCVPHQLEPLGTRLQAEVLIAPDPHSEAAKKVASAADAH